MSRMKLRPILWLCCFTLALVGCSKAPDSPTGLGGGLGVSVQAVTQAEPYRANPFDGVPEKSATAPDVHGTLSVEDFQGTKARLRSSHEAAEGFRDYLTTWHAANYSYHDTEVGAWAFRDMAGGDNWDLWSHEGIDYGVDGVRVCFFSSHGEMDADGTFHAGMGIDWEGRGWEASSAHMTLGGNAGTAGDESLRYMFWDAPHSVRWSDGFDPYTTWGARAAGVRMIFGFDGSCVDSPYIGQFFWEEWSKDQALSQAFLNASWRLNRYQSPTVVAFGATEEEAIFRRDNERMLLSEWASNAWAAWRYYYAAGEYNLYSDQLQASDVPFEVVIQKVSAQGNTNLEVRELAAVMGVEIGDDRAIQDRPYGIRTVRTSDSTLIVEADGDIELTLTREAGTKSAGSVVSDQELVARAEELVEQFGLDKDQSYRFGVIRYLAENSASRDTQPGEPRVVERTVVFDQVVGSMPFVDSDAGHIEVTFDEGSKAVRIRSSVRRIETATEKRGATVPARTLYDVRTIALRSRTAAPIPTASGAVRQGPNLAIVPGTEQLGYQMIGGRAVPVYRAFLYDPGDPGSKVHEAVVSLVAE